MSDDGHIPVFTVFHELIGVIPKEFPFAGLKDFVFHTVLSHDGIEVKAYYGIGLRVFPVDVTNRDGGSDKEVVLEMVFDRSHLLPFLSGRTGGSEKGGCKIAE